MSKSQEQSSEITDKSRFRIVCDVILVLLFVLPISYGVCLMCQVRRAAESENAFRSLCEGKMAVEITHIEIDGHGQHFSLKDRDSIDFLKSVFSKLEAGIGGRQTTGQAYDLHVHRSSGESIVMRMDPFGDMSGMWIGFKWTDHWGTEDEHSYHVSFAEPIPINTRRVVESLIHKWKSGASTRKKLQ